jgi:hypothetical protein
MTVANPSTTSGAAASENIVGTSSATSRSGGRPASLRACPSRRSTSSLGSEPAQPAYAPASTSFAGSVGWRR